MEWNDYLEEVRGCAEEFIDNELDDDVKDFDEAFDILRDDDAVTGNASGSFTMNRAQAKENIEDILWDSEVETRFCEMGYDGFPMSEGPEAIDVIARYIALGELYSELETYFYAE